MDAGHFSNKQITSSLVITEGTVEVHPKIFMELEVAGRSALASIQYRVGRLLRGKQIGIAQLRPCLKDCARYTRRATRSGRHHLRTAADFIEFQPSDPSQL